jgi:hypothetical protein
MVIYGATVISNLKVAALRAGICIGSFRRALAFVAQQSRRRVLPVALAGSKPLWQGKTLCVRIGTPLDPPPMAGSHRPIPSPTSGIPTA